MKSLEVCYKSMNILEKRFGDYRNRPLWIPDWKIERLYEVHEELDVLVMGSFYERIFQPEYWPKTDFNFFCLSQKSRQCLIELYGFDNNVIGLLDRNSLFPRSINQKEFNFNHDSTLVYAGRISPQKNIEFLIFTVFYLQVLFSSRVELILFGNFDNIYHRDILGCAYMDYQKKIIDLIQALPWPGKPPSIISNLSETVWTSQLPQNGFFISASTLISEDFAVAAAQLEEIGYPMLLPYWGGFIDISGTNIRHYSSELICNSHQELTTCSQKAKNLAQKIIANHYPIKTIPSKSQDIYPVKKINTLYLEEIYLKNIIKWGENIRLIRDGEISQYALTLSGQKLFSEYRRLFAS